MFVLSLFVQVYVFVFQMCFQKIIIISKQFYFVAFKIIALHSQVGVSTMSQDLQLPGRGGMEMI